MRIGLIIYGRLDQRSGGYLYDRQLVEYLRRGGHSVQIVSLPWRSYWRHLADNFSSPLFDRLKGLRVDLLLQDELNHPSLFLLNARLKRQVTYPIISMIHLLRATESHPIPLSWFYRFIERRYLNSVDGFIFNSGDTRRQVSRMLTGAKPSIVATPGGDRLRPRVAKAQIRARARRTGPLRVVFLGNLIRRKAPHLLLAAAAGMRDEVRVDFAGRMDMEPAYVRGLRRMVEQSRLHRIIKFHGHLDGADLAKLLRSSQVLVLASAYEGFGIAYLEGMGFGLPAIGTRAGAAGEIIAHGKNGYLIGLGEAGQLKRLLRRLHRDRLLLTRLSFEAFATYQKFPTWQASMARIESFLSRYNQPLLQSKPIRRAS
ncbi:MAG: glycosyltransferase family 4 protein [Anaerolineales bacterium]